MAAAFAIEFLCEAYSKPQFAAVQSDILVKIVVLADWLLTQQCVDPTRAAYGGFKSGESANDYWSIDSGRAIPALLKAYNLISEVEYLNAAKLAGYFLSYMQHEPVTLACMTGTMAALLNTSR
jgi:hypothetical protein